MNAKPGGESQAFSIHIFHDRQEAITSRLMGNHVAKMDTPPRTLNKCMAFNTKINCYMFEGKAVYIFFLKSFSRVSRKFQIDPDR